MRAMRWFVSGIYLLAVTLAVVSCTNKAIITDTIDSDLAHVTGTLYGWYCGGRWDLDNNRRPLDEQRFSVRTGETATITFIRDDGYAVATQSDDSSRYEITVPTGVFRIAIKSAFAFAPDTVRDIILIPGDTALNLDTHLSVFDASHLPFLFAYTTINDTAGMAYESGILNTMNDMSHSLLGNTGVLDIVAGQSLEEFHEFRSTFVTYSYYVIPIRRVHQGAQTDLTVWPAYLHLFDIVQQDTAGVFPSNFHVDPPLSPICILD